MPGAAHGHDALPHAGAGDTQHSPGSDTAGSSGASEGTEGNNLSDTERDALKTGMFENQYTLNKRVNVWQFYRRKGRHSIVGTWRLGSIQESMSARRGVTKLAPITEARVRTKATSKAFLKSPTKTKRKSALSPPKSQKRPKRQRMNMRVDTRDQPEGELTWPEVVSLLVKHTLSPQGGGERQKTLEELKKDFLPRCPDSEGNKINYYIDASGNFDRILTSVIDISGMALFRNRDELDVISTGCINQGNTRQYLVKQLTDLEGHRQCLSFGRHRPVASQKQWQNNDRFSKLVKTIPKTPGGGMFRAVGDETLFGVYYGWAKSPLKAGMQHLRGVLETVEEGWVEYTDDIECETNLNSNSTETQQDSGNTNKSEEGWFEYTEDMECSTQLNSIPKSTETRPYSEYEHVGDQDSDSDMSVNLLDISGNTNSLENQQTGLTQNFLGLDLTHKTGLSQTLDDLDINQSQRTNIGRYSGELNIETEINTPALIELLSDLVANNDECGHGHEPQPKPSSLQGPGTNQPDPTPTSNVNEESEFGISSENFESWSQEFEAWDISTAMLNDLDTSFVALPDNLTTSDVGFDDIQMQSRSQANLELSTEMSSQQAHFQTT